jgi:preprotein translocase subunit SecD
MSTLTDILRDADPLRDEPAWDAHAHHARRSAVMTAAAARRAPAHPSRRWLVQVVAAATLVVAAGVGWRVAPSPAVNVSAAAVRFEVRLAETTPSSDQREAVVSASSRRIYLNEQAIVTNADIASAVVVPGNSSSEFSVEVTFTPEGAGKMRRATEDHIGEPLAILIDGRVALAPMIRSAIDTSAVITGHYSQIEAERIAAGLVGR